MKRQVTASVVLRIAVVLITVIFSFSSAYATDFTAQENRYIENKKRITVGIVADDEPYSYIHHGQYEGFSYDVLQAVSEISGLKFDFRMGNWSEIYKSFVNGELDAIDAISYTDERSRSILFTEPYSIRKTVIFSRADSPVSSFESADGKRLKVGVIRSIYYQKILEKLDNVDVVEYLTYSELMKSLAFGWIDIVVASEFTGLYTSRKYSLSNIIVAGDADLPGIGDEDFRLGVLKTNPVLSSILDKTVKSLGSERMDRISAKWLNYHDFASIYDGKRALTHEEQVFIKSKPVISIGLMPDYKPFSFYEKGDVYGYTRSLLDLVSSYSGLRFNLVVKPWVELMTDFRAGRLDALADMSRTDARDEFTLFTDKYYQIPVVVFVREDFGKYSSMSDLAGKKVGIGEGVFYEEIINKYLDIDVQAFSSQESLMKALAFGKVDAVIAALNMGNNLVSGLALMNIRVAGDVNLPGVSMEDLRFGVREEFPVLQSILNKSLYQISTEEKQAVEQAWLSSLVLSDSDSFLPMTEKEIKFIHDLEKLDVCVDEADMPYLRLEKNGTASGVVPDILTLFSDRTGLHMNPVYSTDKKKCRVFISEKRYDDTSGYRTIMTPAVTSENVIASSVNEPFVTDIENLRGKKIGVTAGSALHRYIKFNYPTIKTVAVKNSETGISRLLNKEIDGYAGNIMDIGYQIQSRSIADIKISGRIPSDYSLHFSVKEEEAELYHLLQKTVASLRESEIRKIENSWMSVRFEQSVDYKLIWKILSVFIIVTAVIAYWTGKLKSLNRELNEANEKLRKMSNRDQLTGLYNRYYLHHQGENALEICRRNKLNMSMAIVDIDHFKNVNDTHGHVTGDECLKMIAVILKDHFQRKSDTVVRFGGEEFLVYFTGDGQEIMHEHMEDVRKHIESQTFKTGAVSLKLNISAGVFCGIPEDSSTLEDYINKADQALYQAKNSGRNRVVSFGA